MKDWLIEIRWTEFVPIQSMPDGGAIGTNQPRSMLNLVRGETYEDAIARCRKAKSEWAVSGVQFLNRTIE